MAGSAAKEPTLTSSSATSSLVSQSFRQPRWKGALAIGVVASVLMAMGLVVAPGERASLVVAPGEPASAATVGDGACTSTVDALTVLTSVTDGRCNILVRAGSGSWTVPAGVNKVRVEVLAGGGGGGNFGGGGGGEAITLSSRSRDAENVPVVPGQVIPISIGDGGTGGNHLTLPTNGGDTTFGPYTAKGGGAGGNWDPVTGVGTAGAVGGSGGGGAPTAIVAEQANPGVVKGAVGGAAAPAGGGEFVGSTAGGAGAGTRTNYPSDVEFTTYLAGGGGGGARSIPTRPDIDAVVAGAIVGDAGTPRGGLGSSEVIGGFGPGGAQLYIAEEVLAANGISLGAVVGPGVGFGNGGGGGIAYGFPGSRNIGLIEPGNGGSSETNQGGVEASAESEGESVNEGPKTPEPNSGHGGGGGGSNNGLRSGSNGASGLVAISWDPPGDSAGAPSAPSNVNGTPGEQSVAATWTAPDSDGGSAITGYGVESSTDGGATWNSVSACSGVATECAVTGLTNGTGYVFRVSATNANGTGPWSDPSGTITPGTTVAPRFTG